MSSTKAKKTAISLCNNCRLRSICNIRVLEAEVGLPKSGISGEIKKRITDCNFYARDISETNLRSEIAMNIEIYLKRAFKDMNMDKHIDNIRKEIFK
jgi:hypothetical protein